MVNVELSQTAASNTLYTNQIVQLTQFVSGFTDDFVYCAVHASRAESGYSVRQNACSSFIYFLHYSTSLISLRAASYT